MNPYESFRTPPYQVFFDVETTGLSPWSGDRICEVGIVIAQGEQILETYASLVNPLRPLSTEAAAVNGLTDEILRHQPTFAEIADQVIERLDGQIVVCHNAPFDLGFLQSELARLGRTWQPRQVIDTLELARQYFHFASNSLPAVAAALGIAVQEAHRALSDALTTYRVFRYFQEVLDAQQNEPSLIPLAPARSWDAQAKIESELPPLLRQALEAQSDLEILYQDGRGNLTRRRIRPLQVLPTPDRVYIVAYCYLREEERHFRLDRIKILPPGAVEDV
ncbi:MAG: exonuclease domain-containing protein [Anaerolineales bacterium]|nr:exonuclease domain-containing protein [Anaerolineales bacterium]MDW8448295.1 exonuclease domain-containing protein [Anaerolineales bacterium]